jgi:nitric oxide reductase activation protein
MERFIQFNDDKIDSMLLMELEDLAKTLTRDKEYEVSFSVHSYLDRKPKKIYISHFWNHRPGNILKAGLKSDVFLRAIGNYMYSETTAAKNYLANIENTHLKRFGKQLFILMEDARVEELSIRERPGIKKAFAIRRTVYRQYFESQRNTSLVKSIHTDALFNTIYLLLFSETPLEEVHSILPSVDLAMPYIKSQVYKYYEAKSTRDIAKLCLELVEVLSEIVSSDMLNEYFHFPDLEVEEEEQGLQFDDLKRKDPLQNEDISNKEKSGEEEIFEEEMKTWHRETSDMSKSFLQFDLEQGTQTDLLGEGVREGEAGDQALAIVQGSVQKTTRNDYSKMEAQKQKRDKYGKNQTEYGKENKHAVSIHLKPDSPILDDIKKYAHYRSEIDSLKRKLTKLIEKTLEHRRNAPRTNIHFGRLNKKLIPFFTDKNPRLFYKKQEPSKEIDAVFSLLVDCSASMYDKMDETKLGIALFHESLKSVKVAHEVVGFWEDTSEATKTMQPNYFKTAIHFSSSLKKQTGPEIMQLEPEEDNRDGFAIRLMTERLKTRYEAQKFLLVFSDGEPAAYGYDQNGIVDTHEAVLEARKNGIEVINIFLSNTHIEESQRNTLKNIYGNFSILVPEIDELPAILFPLLRRLLYRSI